MQRRQGSCAHCFLPLRACAALGLASARTSTILTGGGVVSGAVGAIVKGIAGAATALGMGGASLINSWSSSSVTYSLCTGGVGVQFRLLPVSPSSVSNRWQALIELPQSGNTLLQLCVLHLRFFQDRNLGIGVLPNGEEIFVLLASLGCVTLHRVSAGHAEMRKHAERVANHDSAVIHNFLKFPGGFGTLAGGQVCLATHIDRIEGSKIRKCGAARTA